MKKFIVTIGCVFGVVASGICGVAQASNSQQAVIHSLQNQIQQVQATVPNQIKSQAAATNQAIEKLRLQMQQQIAALQKQLQQVQTAIPKQIKAQAGATNSSVSSLQSQVQKQITQIQAQMQQLQASLSSEIGHLQKEVVSVSQMR